MDELKRTPRSPAMDELERKRELEREFERRHGKHQRIMFWSDTDPPSRFAGLTKDVSKEDVATAVALLRSGKPLQSYMGWAECRICGLMLGTKDVGRFGFVWPEKAEHYIDEHGVWTPGIAAFVAQVKAAKSLKAAKDRP